jgi:hypothetical protein
VRPRVAEMKVGADSRCVLEFDAGDESAMEIYEAFERMLAAWPDARVPLKIGLPLAAKGTRCGCGDDHGGWTCSHCTKRDSQEEAPMASKAVPSSGNTGPRDFSAEVSSNFAGRVPPLKSGAVYMEAKIYLAEEAAGAITVQDVFEAIADMLRKHGIDPKNHLHEALVVDLSPETEAAIRKDMGREP